MEQSKPASQKITEQQGHVRQILPFDDKRDFLNAQRGRVGRRVPNTVINTEGQVSKLTHLDGLFRVTDGIYQVRGLDLSNTTLIESDEGLIVIDPLLSAETAAAAFALYQDHRGKERPVKAIIFTHSHADHFGGVKGFVSEEDVESKGITVLAPEGFLEHAVSENVYTGTAMSRRAAYMYGAALSRNSRGQVGAGLGQTVSTGTVTLIAPNDEIKLTGEERTVDGVRMVFQMAPDTEAPAEMLIYFPQSKALCAAEDATHTFHNVLTLRGALVRDPHSWAKYLTETIDLFGAEVEVVFASHHWPTWDNGNVVDFLSSQRDIYAYVHDQTLRLINKGYNGAEIAEMMTLPPALYIAWSARGYYGSLNHNVKAIYQRYSGWFDGNPAHLWEHIPVERAKRYVNLLGGVDQIMTKAREAFDSGDFRWAAEILNHAIFAQTDNSAVRYLLADTYEQLGYGAENATWRNFFISGSTELRSGNFGTPTQTASSDVVAQLKPEMVFDSFAIQIDGPKACDEKLSIDVVLTDPAVQYRLWLSNGALIYTKAKQSSSSDVTITGTSRQLPLLAVYGFNPTGVGKAGMILTGDSAALGRLYALLDPGDPKFNVVTP